jgi:hypothetical protein
VTVIFENSFQFTYFSEPVCGGGEKEQLTSELQLIENSIQDREREIKINHQRNETATTDE